MHDVEQLMSGAWTPAAGRASFDVVDPADGTSVSRTPVATPADVDAAVKSAREAAPAWAATPAAGRGGALHRAADALAAAADGLARTQTAEMGKPLSETLGGIEAGVGTLRQYAELGPIHRGRSLAGDPGAVDVMAYEPRGVLAAITPWNDPVAVSCGLLGAALVTGNTVVYKPSERTPATGCWHGCSPSTCRMACYRW